MRRRAVLGGLTGARRGRWRPFGWGSAWGIHGDAGRVNVDAAASIGTWENRSVNLCGNEKRLDSVSRRDSCVPRMLAVGGFVGEMLAGQIPWYY